MHTPVINIIIASYVYVDTIHQLPNDAIINISMLLHTYMQ